MSLKILCVDDEAECRNSLKINLEDAITSEVDLASGYKTAMEKIHQTRYDLIILDGLEGDCFRLYEAASKCPHGDIIILSANIAVAMKAEDKGIPFYAKTKQGLDKLIADYRPTSE